MRKIKIITFTFLFVLPVAMASLPDFGELAVSMVPKGKVLTKNFREIVIRTEAGTKVTVEFDRMGKLQEASGLNLNRGDALEPGSGLQSLSTMAQNLSKEGHQLSGVWKLEKDPHFGWVYELHEEELRNRIYHLVNAKNGKVIKSMVVTDSNGS